MIVCAPIAVLDSEFGSNAEVSITAQSPASWRLSRPPAAALPTALATSVAFAPDATCLLATGSDHTIRLLETHTASGQPWAPSIRYSIPSPLYGVAWYPLMSSQRPDTAVFLASAKDQPVHLYDAFTGKSRASYSCYNELEQLKGPRSVAFSSSGEHILCGLESEINACGNEWQRERGADLSPHRAVFHIARPGRQRSRILTGTKNGGKGRSPGVISAISAAADDSYIAFGTYRGHIALLDAQDFRPILEFDSGDDGCGVTQLLFSRDSRRLFHASRKSNAIVVRDVRMIANPMFMFTRDGNTNQSISIDMDVTDQILFSGGRDGRLTGFDAVLGRKKVFDAVVSTDCLNGVSCSAISSHIALSIGERHFILPDSDSDPDPEEIEERERIVSCVAMCHFAHDEDGEVPRPD